jgi:hypothetical protein
MLRRELQAAHEVNSYLKGQLQTAGTAVERIRERARQEQYNESIVQFEAENLAAQLQSFVAATRDEYLAQVVCTGDAEKHTLTIQAECQAALTLATKKLDQVQLVQTQTESRLLAVQASEDAMNVRLAKQEAEASKIIRQVSEDAACALGDKDSAIQSFQILLQDTEGATA